MINYLETIFQFYKEILRFCSTQKEILGIIAICCALFSIFWHYRR